MTAATSHASPRNPSLAFLALLGAGVAVGFSPIFAKLSDLAPVASGFYRLALAVPVVWAICRLSGERAAAPRDIARGDLIRLILAGVAFAADIACWHLSLSFTRVGEATLLASMAPVIVTSVAVMVLGERIRPLFLVGLAIALAGVATLALQPVTGGAMPPNRRVGDVLAVSAASFYTVYVILIMNVRKRSTTATIMIYTTAAGAIAMLPFALATAPNMIPGSLYFWIILIALAAVSHAGGQGLLAYSLAHLPVSLSSMIGLMQAAIAAVGAWIIFNEPLTLTMILSAVAILGGIFICRQGSMAGA
ncbi:DMT family transporter [soil metagenome]